MLKRSMYICSCSAILSTSFANAPDNKIQSVTSKLHGTTFHDLGPKTAALLEDYAKDDLGTLEGFAKACGTYRKDAQDETTSRVAVTALIVAAAVGLSWSGTIDKLGEKLPGLFGGARKSEAGFMSYIGYSAGACGMIIWPLAINDCVSVGAGTAENLANYLKDPTAVTKWSDDPAKLENQISAAIVGAIAASANDIPEVKEANKKIAEIVAYLATKPNYPITKDQVFGFISRLPIEIQNQFKELLDKTPMKIIRDAEELSIKLKEWLKDVHAVMGRDTKQQRKELSNETKALFKEATKQTALRVGKWIGIFAASTLATQTIVFGLGITHDLHKCINNDWIDALNKSPHLRHAHQAFNYASTGMFVAFTVYPVGTKINELRKKVEQNEIKPNDAFSLLYSLKSLAR